MASILHQFIARLSRQVLVPGVRRRIRTAVIPEQLETRILLSNAPVLLEGNPDGDSFPGEAVATTKGIFSQAFEPTTGYEIYLSDGTTAGTKMVRDLYSGATSSHPGDFTEGDGVIFFTAVTQNRGRELWKTDGTIFGTSIVADINPGAASSDPDSLTFVNGTLYFSATDGATGRELWKSDGTLSGTVRVKDIVPGGNSSDPDNFQEFDDVLLFTATTSSAGDELWRSDGTVAGTFQVKEIFEGASSSAPEQFTRVGSVVYFTAEDPDQGRELWKTNGTTSGTVLVSDIIPGPGSSSPTELTPVSATTLYFAATTAATGNELWKTSGSAASTVMVKDIYPGASSSFPSDLVNAAGVVYFAAEDGVNGEELWKSNGTGAGTVLVADIFPGATSSSPVFLSHLNGKVYFGAENAVVGDELFESNGTAAGTKLVADIWPGATGSFPVGLLTYKDYVFFAANDGLHSNEPFAYNTRPTIVIDNHNVGYSETGKWALSQVAGVNGSRTRFSNEPTAKARWSAAGVTTGYYRVEIFKVVNSTNARTINVQVVSADGTSTTPMSFSGGSPSGWTQVGIFRFTGSATQLVSISNPTGSGNLRADAVRFTPVNRSEIVDAGSANYSETGTWSESLVAGNNGSTTRLSSSLNASARYNTSIRAGYYTVQIYLVIATGNATNVEITVASGGKTRVYKVNMATGTSRWLTLGKFYFSGSGEEYVQIRNAGTTGRLRTDAVQFFEEPIGPGL